MPGGERAMEDGLRVIVVGLSVSHEIARPIDLHPVRQWT
jgi:hypothetical protein